MLNCLIVGLGNIGMGYDIKKRNIQSHSKAIEIHEGFNLSGAIEKNKQKRILFEKKYKKPTFKTFKSSFKLIKPDIVIISSSTDSHLTVLKDILLLHKPKAIVCEKPLGTNLKESLEIYNLCKNNKIRLYVNFFRLSDPGIIKLKRKFVTPIEGSIIYSRGTLNNASHFINTLQFWFGRIVKVNLIKKGSKFNKFDFNSSFSISFKYANFIFKPTNIKNRYTNSIIIHAKNGTLFYLNGGTNINWQKKKGDKKNSQILNDKTQKLYSGKKYSQLHFVNNLYYALKGKKSDICNGHKAIKTLKIISSLYDKK
tara:strand:+ start:1077 stop:2009 length:933 start_codon:yes stop_codon:yes gene_type:complete